MFSFNARKTPRTNKTVSSPELANCRERTETVVILHDSSPAARYEMTVKAAAKVIDISPGSVNKLLACEYLPYLTYPSVASLANRDLITSTEPITAIRMGLPGEEPGTGRKTGVSPRYTNDEFCDASRGDWISDPAVVVANRWALVVLANFILGLLDVTALEDTIVCVNKETGHVETRRKYEAALVARVDNLLDLSTVHAEPGVPAELVGAIGHRIRGIGGTPVISYTS